MATTLMKTRFGGSPFSLQTNRAKNQFWIDSHHLLTKMQFNTERLRLAFVLYMGMSSIIDPQEISLETLLLDENDFQRQLLPVLRRVKKQENHQSWKKIKLQECKQALTKLIPFTDKENEFLIKLIEEGEIHASLLTNESKMQTKIENLPLLQWRASLAKSLIR